MEGGVTYRRNMITPTPVQSNEDDEADPETDADGKNQYRFVIPEGLYVLPPMGEIT